MVPENRGLEVRTASLGKLGYSIRSHPLPPDSASEGEVKESTEFTSWTSPPRVQSEQAE